MARMRTNATAASAGCRAKRRTKRSNAPTPLADGARGEEAGADVPQEDGDESGAEDDAEQDGVTHAGHRLAYERRLVVDRLDGDMRRQGRRERARGGDRAIDDLRRARARKARHAD